MGNHDIVADRRHVADTVAEIRSTPRLLLEADVNGMKLIVPLHESAEGTAPDDVRRKLAIQQLGITLVVACLKAGGEPLDCGLGLTARNCYGWATEHGGLLPAAKWLRSAYPATTGLTGSGATLTPGITKTILDRAVALP